MFVCRKANFDIFLDFGRDDVIKCQILDKIVLTNYDLNLFTIYGEWDIHLKIFNT